MQKIVFGIFAHPDDEAFGPCGTLLREVAQGAQLQLITLTAGEQGANPDNQPDLRQTRLKEWRAAGALFGASDMHYLGLADGKLGNVSMLKAVEQIEAIVRRALTQHEGACTIDFISMDTDGITGHIDHIVASRAAHHVFYKLKDAGLPLGQLRLTCLPRDQAYQEPTYDFVFIQAGRPPEEIDEIVDARDRLPQIHAIMRAHHSQRGDGQVHIQQRGENIAIDHFVIKT